jgi:hypothetical protein
MDPCTTSYDDMRSVEEALQVYYNTGAPPPADLDPEPVTRTAHGITCDVQDAFYVLDCDVAHQKYLYHEIPAVGSVYVPPHKRHSSDGVSPKHDDGVRYVRCRAMPMGMASSPGHFKELTDVIKAHLNKTFSVRTLWYLDDMAALFRTKRAAYRGRDLTKFIDETGRVLHFNRYTGVALEASSR